MRPNLSPVSSGLLDLESVPSPSPSVTNAAVGAKAVPSRRCVTGRGGLLPSHDYGEDTSLSHG